MHSVPVVGTVTPVALPDGVEDTAGPLVDVGHVGLSLLYGKNGGSGETKDGQQGKMDTESGLHFEGGDGWGCKVCTERLEAKSLLGWLLALV